MKRKIITSILCVLTAVTITVPGFAAQPLSSEPETTTTQEQKEYSVTEEESADDLSVIGAEDEQAQDGFVTTQEETKENSLSVSAEEEEALSEGQPEEEAKAEDAEEPTDVKIVEDAESIAEVSNKEIKNQQTDAVTEKYILDNLDRSILNGDSLTISNAVYVKQSLFDGKSMDKGDTPESIMTAIEEGTDEEAAAAFNKYLTQMSGVVAVYDADAESEYYVAFLNTLQNTSGIKTDDCVFANYNDYAEVLEGCIYDEETGLAYIPKDCFKEGEIMGVQAQLMQVVNDYENTEMTTETTSNPAGFKRPETYVTASELFDQSTLVQTTAGLNDEKLEVAVNGIPIEEEFYSYDTETGTLQLEVAPAICQTVSVTDSTNVVANSVGKLFGPTVANALTVDTMGYYKGNAVTIPSNVTSGALFTGTFAIRYSDGGQIHVSGLDNYHYGYAHSEAGLVNMINAIQNNRLDMSSLQLHTHNTGMFTFVADLSANAETWRSTTGNISGAFMAPWGQFTLECAHTTSSLLGKDSSINTSWNQARGAVRFFEINREKGYAIIGMMTAQRWTQMGVGIFKVHIETPPEVAYTNASKSVIYKKPCQLTIKKTNKDGDPLQDARFRVYLNDKFITKDAITNRNGTVTVKDTVVFEKTYTSGNYAYASNYNLLSATQKAKCIDEATAKARANAAINAQIEKDKNAFAKKTFTWKVFEMEAPEGYYVSSHTSKKPYKVVTTTTSMKKNTAATDKKELEITDKERTASIRIIKYNKTAKSYTKMINPAAQLDKAVYGIYTRSNCSEDSLVATVKIKYNKETNKYEGTKKGLKTGTYWIQEITPPPGMDRNETIQKVEAKLNKEATIKIDTDTLLVNEYDTTTKKITYRDGKKAVVKAGGNNASGVDVTYISEESETNADLEIYKKYEPNGGSPLPEENATFKLVNTKTKKMIYKKSGSTKATDKVAEAESKVYTLKTNANGYAKLTELPAGTYTLTQLDGKKGYDMIPDTTIKVTESGTITKTFTDKELYGRLEIHKVTADADGSNRQNEEGASFAIYNKATMTMLMSDAEGNVTENAADAIATFYTIKTNANGDAALNNIPYGTYIIKQIGGKAGYTFISDDEFTIDSDTAVVSGVPTVSRTGENSYTNYREDTDRIRLKKFYTTQDNDTGTHVREKEHGAIFKVYKDYVSESNPGTLVDIIVTGAISSGNTNETAARSYASYLAGESSTEPVGSPYTAGETGEAVSRVITVPEGTTEEYTIVQIAGKTGYAFSANKGIVMPSEEPVIAENWYDGEKLHLHKVMKDIRGQVSNEPSVSFLVFDIAKAKALGEDGTFGRYPYEAYLKNADTDNEENEASREALMQYLTDNGCVLEGGDLTTDSKGEAYMLLPNGSYGSLGFAVLQYTGEENYTLKPIMESADAQIETETAKGSNVTTRVFTYEMTDEQNNYGYLKVMKEKTVSKDNTTGEYITKAEQGAVYQILKEKEAEPSNEDSASEDDVIEAGEAEYEIVMGRDISDPAHPVIIGKDLVTNENGTFTTDALEYGRYILRQIKGAQGHELAPDTVFVLSDETIDENRMYKDAESGSIGIRQVNEEKEIRLILTKTELGYDAHYLNGAVFRVIDNNSGEMLNGQPKPVAILETADIETTENGSVITLHGTATADLQYGNFTLQEIKAPNGYQKCEDIRFTINDYNVKYDSDGKGYYELKAEDSPLFGKIKLTKKGQILTSLIKNGEESDSTFNFKADEAVSGATYSLYAKNDIKSADGEIIYYRAGTKIAEGTTGVDGTITFRRTLSDGTTTDEMYLGDYYVQETASPDDYILDENRYDVTLSTTPSDEEYISAIQHIDAKDYAITDKNRYAYAVLGDDGTLTFFRSGTDYTNYLPDDAEDEEDTIDCSGQTSGSLGFAFEDIYGNRHEGKLYTGVEDTDSQIPWEADKQSIQAVGIAKNQVIRPQTTKNWFAGCDDMEECDLTGLDTSAVTDMSGMFDGAESLRVLSQNMNTDSAQNMSKMFKGCEALTWLDLSGFGTSAVTATDQMFSGDTSLKTIYVSDKWNSTAIMNGTSAGMFENCTNLPNFNSSAVDGSKATADASGYLTMTE